jgi:hypothetical protein
MDNPYLKDEGLTADGIFLKLSMSKQSAPIKPVTAEMVKKFLRNSAIAGTAGLGLGSGLGLYKEYKKPHQEIIYG